jgi:hypothetical protein
MNAKLSILAIAVLTSAWAARGQSRPASAPSTRPTTDADRPRILPIAWPADADVLPRGAEQLREERRIFADELRALKQWIPDNMRGATTRQWTRGQKTMISESKAIEHVPDMPADQVERIIADMEQGARDTVFDNLARFRAALARRVPVVAQANAAFGAGEYAKAAETLKVLTKENVLHAFFAYQYDTLPPYIYSTVTWFEGEAYGLDGAVHESLIRYLIVCKSKLPLSMTFSAAGRMRIGEMYERSARSQFAIPIYQSLAEKYAESLRDVEMLRVHVRIRRLMREDHFRKAVAVADEVKRLKDRGRIGPTVQAAQSQLAHLMHNIISDEEIDGRGNLQINWEMMAGEEQFTRGGLQEGAAPTKFTWENEVLMAGNDDWGKLRPREKQEVIQRFFESCPDEYRPMMEAYFRNMSRAQNGGGK